MFEADPELKEALRHVAETTALALDVPEADRARFIERAADMFPAIMTLSGISACRPGNLSRP